MRSDPVADLREALTSALMERGTVDLKADKPLNAKIPWSPHLYDLKSRRAWHCLSEPPESNAWISRMRRARAMSPTLSLGVCAPINVMLSEEVLDAVDDLEASTATVMLGGSTADVTFSGSAADLIYEMGLKLSRDYATRILDRLLVRCAAAKTTDAKGVTLEVLTAVLLSQVEGFEVVSRGLSNRSQQIDVQIHNRRVTGLLGGSDIVIAEAKNWRNPVGTVEYYSVVRKIETRFGRSRLGFFITTDRFTAGVAVERLRDSKGGTLVVPIDKASLPSLWSSGDGITRNLEAAAIRAASE
jgi:hypothetical protein